MITVDQMLGMKEIKAQLKPKKDESATEFKKRKKEVLRKAEFLQDISVAYDLVFDEGILGKPENSNKRAFQALEKVLAFESKRLRRELKINAKEPKIVKGKIDV